ncbi:hypothetical protein BKA70DRAFT_1394657 [Coprinopsis sp. MPI-PUGE-AT-0042]|nr:hypothetical protein BKA70DRAFT_1394657 [Coprinopsis sp. MPI-PUGE-AT-0042]
MPDNIHIKWWMTLSLDANLELLRATQVVGWNFAAAVALLVYDVILTFPDEVRLIWPIPWTFTKGVFFIIRYFTMILGMSTQFYGVPLLEYSPRSCYIWNVYQCLGAVLVFGSVDYILVLRVFAMYPRNKPIRWLSAALYAAEMSIMAVGLVKAPGTTLVTAGCQIIFQSFLFVVTLWNFIGAVKEGWGNVPLVVLLIRDGTWAFLLLFAILISEAALFGFSPGGYTSILYGWLHTAFSVCGYRILLNLHGASKYTSDQGGGFSTTDVNGEFTSVYTSTSSDPTPRTSKRTFGS